MDLPLPVDVQHHIELLGVPVEEEDWDGARDKPVTQIFYFLQTGGGTDQAQTRRGKVPEVGKCRPELLTAHIDYCCPWSILSKDTKLLNYLKLSFFS